MNKETNSIHHKTSLLKKYHDIPNPSNISLEKIQTKSFGNELEYYQDKKTKQFYTLNVSTQEWLPNH